jgi:hypothetical protein
MPLRSRCLREAASVDFESVAPVRRISNGHGQRARRSSTSFLCQKCGTCGVLSQVRMLVSTKRRTPTAAAASTRLRLPMVSVCAVS